MPQYISYSIHSRGVSPNHAVSLLFAADGSLLFVSEFIPHLDNDPDDRNDPKQILKSYVYHPGKFPARALYTPPFRTRGMSGNRPFNRRCLSLLRQRVSTLSLYTPFFPLSNSVDIIFTEILFSKSPLSQYKVFKVQTGELSEFLLGRSSPISEEKLCFQTLVFNLLT